MVSTNHGAIMPTDLLPMPSTPTTGERYAAAMARDFRSAGMPIMKAVCAACDIAGDMYSSIRFHFVYELVEAAR